MTTIQHSIKVNVPAHLLYKQLTRFEDYPQFMDNVEKVQKIDNAHLHWTTRMANRPVEWDAEIIKEEAGHSIAWRNTQTPHHTSSVEVEPLNSDTAKVTFILEAEPGQFPGLMAGDNEEEMVHHLSQNLARLKDFMETGRSDQTGRISGTQLSPASTSASPTEVLVDEPNESGPGVYSGGNPPPKKRK